MNTRMATLQTSRYPIPKHVSSSLYYISYTYVYTNAFYNFFFFYHINVSSCIPYIDYNLFIFYLHAFMNDVN